MGLRYRGARVSQEQDIIRLLDARAKAQEATSAAQAQSVIDAGITGLASKAYVDSAFTNYATQADVDAAYVDRAPKTALGTSALQLFSPSGRIPFDALPTLSTRGAVWVRGGAITPRLDIGDVNPVQLGSLTVSGSAMGNRPFQVWPWAQIECKGNFGNSNPVIYFSDSSTSSTRSIGTGHGIPGWLDYYHLSLIPTTGDSSPQVFTGSKVFYLTCKSFGTSSDFTNYYPEWGCLAIPIIE